MAISNKIKIRSLLLANYKKTSLKNIEEKRNEQLKIMKNNTLENYKKSKSFDLEKKPKKYCKNKSWLLFYLFFVLFIFCFFFSSPLAFALSIVEGAFEGELTGIFFSFSST